MFGEACVVMVGAAGATGMSATHALRPWVAA
jgi:hypothetical protein